jgi:hypothetical protein
MILLWINGLALDVVAIFLAQKSIEELHLNLGLN